MLSPGAFEIDETMGDDSNVVSSLDKDEPILIEQKKRFVLFPIKHHKIWQTYKTAEAKFWSAEELELSDDVDGWEHIAQRQRVFFTQLIAILASSDTVVPTEFINRFSDEIQAPEARCMFGFQLMQRNIHNELFHVILDLYAKSSIDQELAFDNIRQFDSMSRKAAWVEAHLSESGETYSTRIVALAIYSSVYFTSTIATLVHMLHPRRNEPAILPGLLRAIAKMYRDHNLYISFYRAVSLSLINRPDRTQIQRIAADAIGIEIDTLIDTFGVCGSALSEDDAMLKTEVAGFVVRRANAILSGFECGTLAEPNAGAGMWIDGVLEDEVRADDSEMSGMQGIEFTGAAAFGHPNLPSEMQINVRQQFSLEEDF
ncbi:ferritin-like superfamily [Cladochytrium replicatum]|nr:ferritin-like superfamily [Cladochytrium replicatum]